MTSAASLPRLTDPPTFTDRAACEAFIRRVREVEWLDEYNLTDHLVITGQVRFKDMP